jgi:hypothetical protein
MRAPNAEAIFDRDPVSPNLALRLRYPVRALGRGPHKREARRVVDLKIAQDLAP